jgi:hypothetical protein
MTTTSPFARPTGIAAGVTTIGFVFVRVVITTGAGGAAPVGVRYRCASLLIFAMMGPLQG